MVRFPPISNHLPPKKKNVGEWKVCSSQRRVAGGGYPHSVGGCCSLGSRNLQDITSYSCYMSGAHRRNNRKNSAAHSVVSRLIVFVENDLHVIPVTGLERVRDIQQKVSERFGMQVYGIKRDNDLLHPNCKIKKRLQDGDQVEALTDGEYFDMVYSSRRNLIRPKGKRKAWNPGRK